MADENITEIPNAGQQPKNELPSEADLSEKYLSNALRLSFFALKLLMIVLVAFFAISGFKRIEANEKGIILRFGKIHSVGDDGMLGPGPHLVYPYPIDEVITIPVGAKPNISINLFWYAMTREEQLNPDKPPRRIKPELDPLKDGYCLIRSEPQGITYGDLAGSDYNIIHSKWQITYQIKDAMKFYQNIYVDTSELLAGQKYSDVITENITPFMENLAGSSIVTAMVNYTIEEAMFEKIAAVTANVKKLMQLRLDQIDSGITVISVQLDDIRWPKQVNQAFLDSIRASQTSATRISDAKTYAQNTLNEAAGPVADELIDAIKNEQISEEDLELLWDHAAGQAREVIAQAKAYRTQVIETAKANADYLETILPEYRKRPELVLNSIYQETMAEILAKADEKIIIQPTKSKKNNEVRIQLNRDASLKPRKTKSD